VHNSCCGLTDSGPWIVKQPSRGGGGREGGTPLSPSSDEEDSDDESNFRHQYAAWRQQGMLVVKQQFQDQQRGAYEKFRRSSA
jgi:hypothetical protein